MPPIFHNSSQEITDYNCSVCIYAGRRACVLPGLAVEEESTAVWVRERAGCSQEIW